jgi:hypothetical protein
LISIIEPGAESGVGVQFMLRPFVKTESGEWRGGGKGILSESKLNEVEAEGYLQTMDLY